MGLNKIASKLEDYVVMDYPFDMPHVIGSCNGLLLLEGRVVNPATRRWTCLPPCPALPEGTSSFGMDNPYLAFDPVVSPHYEVVLMKDCFDYDSTLLTNSEWPPSPYTMCAYSSETGAWKERSFVREGRPACTLAAVQAAPEPEYRHCAYWRGALYVHCKSDLR
ncbi:hypothetical protein PR202_ga16686 [Eleusine coracana subsp. coracana]|uniref:Uncharacterized protein n=1 Tax=Eleusine coracana subsp. coracana TaxID=191504 RepID=A0AAV5CNG2_ELECO|nr:hypothetical protein QOZ80_6AG0525610 [Eleusine coracana subsp. coracana]GJM99572.1 hypothetical protein PR202_ga16686 [Eleusine coracana subsp. coracana]